MTTSTTRKTSTAPDPRTIWRQEVAAAERTKHEQAYFLHVVCPLALAGFPRPKPQAMLIPGRRYKWDYAWIAARVAVEIQGQIWQTGGHTTGRGITRDAQKINALAGIGWTLVVITPEMIASGEAREATERALHAAGWRGAA